MKDFGEIVKYLLSVFQISAQDISFWSLSEVEMHPVQEPRWSSISLFNQGIFLKTDFEVVEFDVKKYAERSKCGWAWFSESH